jgi:hypothetical protein
MRKHNPEEGKKNLEVTSLAAQEWMGQSVQSNEQIVYLSVFRDLKN